LNDTAKNFDIKIYATTYQATHFNFYIFQQKNALVFAKLDHCHKKSSFLALITLTLTVQDDHPGDVLAASEIFVLMPLWLNH
jgi:hypothetical protein